MENLRSVRKKTRGAVYGQEHTFPRNENKVAAGKTPAGRHRPVMVEESLAVLAIKPGETVADGTLGYGGHTREFLRAVAPGGRVIALDVDPLQLHRITERLRREGFGDDVLVTQHSNFAGLPRVLTDLDPGDGVDAVFADLGASSMQIDEPARGCFMETGRAARHEAQSRARS